jgi:serine O-acetyltransferase
MCPEVATKPHCAAKGTACFMPERITDPVWERISKEVALEAAHEPMLASFFHAVVLNHHSLDDALSFLLASKLESQTLNSLTLRDLIHEAFVNDPAIGEACRIDIVTVCERDPACTTYYVPLLYFKGFQAIQCHRVAHYYWRQDRQPLALWIQSRVAEIFGVDIHPAARIGRGILIDHATGVVIGETAVVEDHVSMLQGVTLGGTGKEMGDRHPKVRRGVLIGAGAKILGNVEIGEGAKIGANAVVLEDVPAHTTIVGVPGKVVGHVDDPEPALTMEHRIAMSETPRD